jgi:hypothetical protein
MDPERHPTALGGRGREYCADIWDLVGPQIGYVMAGAGSIWEEDRPMPVMRNGRRENAWWSYSYGPIDAEGGVGGILVVCSEVTAQHQAAQGFQGSDAAFQPAFHTSFRLHGGITRSGPHIHSDQ